MRCIVNVTTDIPGCDGTQPYTSKRLAGTVHIMTFTGGRICVVFLIKKEKPFRSRFRRTLDIAGRHPSADVALGGRRLRLLSRRRPPARAADVGLGGGGGGGRDCAGAVPRRGQRPPLASRGHQGRARRVLRPRAGGRRETVACQVIHYK